MYCSEITSTYGFLFFFFNDTATTEIYTLSLHDALPIFGDAELVGQLTGESTGNAQLFGEVHREAAVARGLERGDRKSTRLNSSHSQISYAVFCLKQKKISTPFINTPFFCRVPPHMSDSP